MCAVHDRRTQTSERRSKPAGQQAPKPASPPETWRRGQKFPPPPFRKPASGRPAPAIFVSNLVPDYPDLQRTKTT